MTNQEIFSLITEKREKIEKLTDFTTFVLNKEVVELQNEIENLQAQCTHDYQNRLCKYCGKEGL